MDDYDFVRRLSGADGAVSAGALKNGRP